jgi:hypothetical protein
MKTCYIDGDVGIAPDTWRDRLLRKLGPDFSIKVGKDREMLMKRCVVLLWTGPQVGTIEIAFVSNQCLNSLPNNKNPMLTTHSTADKKRLRVLLSNRWKIEIKPTSKVVVPDSRTMTG